MLTKEQYLSAIERLEELSDFGRYGLSAEEKQEQDRLAKATEEYEAHDHKILNI